MLTVLGSINIDQIGQVERMPLPGETVAGKSYSIFPGGKGANQALAAKRAGSMVRLVGAVGDDNFAPAALATLRRDGVDLSDVQVLGAPTGAAFILVDERGENVIAVFPGANAELSQKAADLALREMDERSILLLQQEIPQAVTLRALDLAHTKGVKTVFNTAPFLPSTGQLACKASIVIANETEFRLMTGADPSPAVMRDWIAGRDQTLIVTMGAAGVRGVCQDNTYDIRAYPIVPIDTVGAGDTFAGYLGSGLDMGLKIEDALHRATKAASLACTRRGAQPSIPTVDEVFDAPLVG